MAIKRKQQRDETPVTLITNDVLTPYAKGEVFTVPKWQADILLDGDRIDGDNQEIPVKVEVYNPDRKDHVAALEAQRGKPVDQDVTPVSPEAPKAAAAPAVDTEAIKAQVLEGVKAEAQKIVDEAKAQAAQIIEDAKAAPADGNDTEDQKKK